MRRWPRRAHPEHPPQQVRARSCSPHRCRSRSNSLQTSIAPRVSIGPTCLRSSWCATRTLIYRVAARSPARGASLCTRPPPIHRVTPRDRPSRDALKDVGARRSALSPRSSADALLPPSSPRSPPLEALPDDHSPLTGTGLAGTRPCSRIRRAAAAALPCAALARARPQERGTSPSLHPQAHFINARTMEIFRHYVPGLDAQIRNAGPPADHWRCARARRRHPLPASRHAHSSLPLSRSPSPVRLRRVLSLRCFLVSSRVAPRLVDHRPPQRRVSKRGRGDSRPRARAVARALDLRARSVRAHGAKPGAVTTHAAATLSHVTTDRPTRRTRPSRSHR